MASVVAGNTLLGFGAIDPCSGETTGVGVPPACVQGTAFVPVGLHGDADARLHPVLVTLTGGAAAGPVPGVVAAGSLINIFDLSCSANPRYLARLGNTVVWQPVSKVMDSAPLWRVTVPGSPSGAPLAPRQRFQLASPSIWEGGALVGSGPSGQLQMVPPASGKPACVPGDVNPVFFFFTAAADALWPSFQLPVWVPGPIVYQFPAYWPRPYPMPPWSPGFPAVGSAGVIGHDVRRGCNVAAGYSWNDARGECCRHVTSGPPDCQPRPLPPLYGSFRPHDYSYAVPATGTIPAPVLRPSVTPVPGGYSHPLLPAVPSVMPALGAQGALGGLSHALPHALAGPGRRNPVVLPSMTV